jgi:ABC-type glycerol-3-phosphate transport system permease component
MTARAGVSASWRYGLLSAGAVVMMAPLIWMVLASSKTLPEILNVPPTLLPETFESVKVEGYNRSTRVTRVK